MGRPISLMTGPVQWKMGVSVLAAGVMKSDLELLNLWHAALFRATLLPRDLTCYHGIITPGPTFLFMQVSKPLDSLKDILAVEGTYRHTRGLLPSVKCCIPFFWVASHSVSMLDKERNLLQLGSCFFASATKANVLRPCLCTNTCSFNYDFI